MEKNFISIYDKFKVNFYKNIFSKFEYRDPTLSVLDIFSADVIYALGRPTISAVTDFMGISQPNTAYRINSLIKKGYLKKVQSEFDKREFYLELTDRYFEYNDIKENYINLVLGRLRDRLSEDEIKNFEKILKMMDTELIPEVTSFQKNEN